MKDHLVEIAKYNLWANRRILNLVNKNSLEKVSQEIISSYPSILQTLHHIWGAENIWLKRLKGETLKGFPTFEGTLVQQFESGLNVSENYLRYVEESEQDYLESKCEFLDTKGTAYSLQIQHIIHHTMNHSTQHRGQIITMSRQLDFQNIESIDFTTYITER